MMDDTISRQAAIDALIRKMRPHDNGDGTMTICVMSEGLVRETLNDLPSAEPSATLMKVEVGVDKESLRKAMEEAELTLVAEPRKWISMAKRSPEESGRYLVTIYDGAKTMVTVARRLPRKKAWEITGRRAHYCVTAWMPLPKPYEEESDGS